MRGTLRPSAASPLTKARAHARGVMSMNPIEFSDPIYLGDRFVEGFTFDCQKGKLEPVIHLELEGPMNAPKLDSLEKASLAVAKMIKPEVDPEYKNENEMYPGLSFDLVEINGSKVGFLGYKFKPEPNTYMRRAVMFWGKGVYSFAITIHLSVPENESKLLLSKFLIASINSGKL